MSTLGRLRENQWTFISLNIIQNKEIQLFLNSKLSATLQVELSENTLRGSGIFYVGGDPWHATTYKAYLDDLTIRTSLITCKLY